MPILAEGLFVESYLDTGDRGGFFNADGPQTLYPRWGSDRCDITLIMDTLGYAPLRVSGAEVDRVRCQLQARLATQSTGQDAHCHPIVEYRRYHGK